MRTFQYVVYVCDEEHYLRHIDLDLYNRLCLIMEAKSLMRDVLGGYPKSKMFMGVKTRQEGHVRELKTDAELFGVFFEFEAGVSLLMIFLWNLFP